MESTLHQLDFGEASVEIAIPKAIPEIVLLRFDHFMVGHSSTFRLRGVTFSASLRSTQVKIMTEKGDVYWVRKEACRDQVHAALVAAGADF